MPSLTPGELQDAKRRATEERKQLKEQERVEKEDRQRQLEERRAYEVELKRRFYQVDSFVKGIHDELTRLFGKKPKDPASPMTIDRANRGIRDVRALISDEENEAFRGEIKELVPAGDLIEIGDVLVTLRIVKDALDRMESRHYSHWHPKPERDYPFSILDSIPSLDRN